MSSGLLDKTSQALSASLNMRQLRHNVISGNIANAETPGYHAMKVDFEDALARAVDLDGFGNMSASNEAHFQVGGNSLSKVAPEVYENPEGAINNDKNTVDLEKEMSGLAENTVLYKAALQLINKKLAALRYAAAEGNR